MIMQQVPLGIPPNTNSMIHAHSRTNYDDTDFIYIGVYRNADFP